MELQGSSDPTASHRCIDIYMRTYHSLESLIKSLSASITLRILCCNIQFCDTEQITNVSYQM